MAATLATWVPPVAPRTVDGTSLLIGGRETTVTDLRARSLRCELLLDARSKFSCQLIAPPVIPTVDMDVLFTLEGTPVFGGIVLEVARAGDLWTLTAGDHLAILDGLLINNVSPAGTLKSVLEWMVGVILGTYGFTVDPAQAAGPTLPLIAYPFQSYAAALKQLGTLSGWSLSVSPTRVLRMYPGGAVPAPWAIDAVTDTIQSLTARTSREGHATQVWVRFGSGPPSDVTWTTDGFGFDHLGEKWSPPYHVTTPPPAVTMNAVTYPVGPYPPDPGWTGWTWEPVGTSGWIHAPASDPPYGASDVLSVNLVANWPSTAVATDPATPYLPLEIVIDYPDIFDAALAQDLADGELARRQGFPQRFTLRTARVGLQPGQQAAIDVPTMDLDTDALVTGVRLVHTQNVGPAGVPWWAFDVELVEANASRSNWLTFWEQLKGGAAGGTGSSITGTIPPAPPTGGGGTGSAVDYATWPLGGDHDAGYPSATGTDWLGIANACFAVTPAAFTGRTWTVYATVKRLLGAGTFQLALTNAAGTRIATSAVVTFAGGEFASVVFTAPVVPGETYHLRGLTSNTTTIVGTTGYLEAVLA
jgi:hypothetical protein